MTDDASAQPTKAELLREIQDELGTPETWRGKDQLRATELNNAAKRLGIRHAYGAARETRKQIRQELQKREDGGFVTVHRTDTRPLRRQELRELRDALANSAADDPELPLADRMAACQACRVDGRAEAIETLERVALGERDAGRWLCTHHYAVWEMETLEHMEGREGGELDAE